MHREVEKLFFHPTSSILVQFYKPITHRSTLAVSISNLFAYNYTQEYDKIRSDEGMMLKLFLQNFDKFYFQFTNEITN